jgi:predicted nucleic acid-binding protein
LIKEASKHKVQTIGTVEVLEIAAKKNIVSYNKAKIILDEMEIKANFKLTTTIKKPK